MLYPSSVRVYYVSIVVYDVSIIVYDVSIIVYDESIISKSDGKTLFVSYETNRLKNLCTMNRSEVFVSNMMDLTHRMEKMHRLGLIVTLPLWLLNAQTLSKHGTAVE